MTLDRDLVADASAALRRTMPAGALALMAAGVAPSPIRAALERANAAQAAAMRALALTGNPDAARRVTDEATRRSELMKDYAAGWTSVADDLAAARWRP